MRDRFYHISAFILQNLAWPIEVILFRKYLSLSIQNKEHLKEAYDISRKTGRGILIVTNHTSELDQILVAASLGFLSRVSPLFYVARARKDTAYERDRWGWRAFTYRHWFLRLFGAYPIIPNQKNYAVTLKNHTELLKEGRSLVIFPEGNVTRDTFRGTPKGGLGYLVKETCPIVLPLYIDGLWKMSSQEFWEKKRAVTVVYKKPVRAEDIVQADFSQIESEFQEISKKIMDLVYP